MQTSHSLEGVQWNGDNLADVEHFVGAPCVVSAAVLRVPLTNTDATGMLGVPIYGWVVRADGELRMLPPTRKRGVQGPQGVTSRTAPQLERLVDHMAIEGGFD